MPNSSFAPASLSGSAKRMWTSTYNSAWKGTCKKDDKCAAKVAWSAVKKKYKKVGDNWVAKSEAGFVTKSDAGYLLPSKDPDSLCGSCAAFSLGACTLVEKSDNILGTCDLYEEHGATPAPIVSRELSMYITRATVDQSTGQRRWAATASDTGVDNYGTRMSLTLFADFIERVKKNEEVPEGTAFRSDFWKGGMPYLSVAHYLDLNGFGVLGPTTDLFVDGNKFKAKGLFENPLNPELVDAAFEAIRSEYKNPPQDKGPVRISIAFIDWQHIHDEWTFVRESIHDVCPICAFGILPDEFQKGQLVHLATTRVPVNERSDIGIEERSMTTRLQDAASIVGKEKAAELDAKTKELLQQRSDADGESQAIVVRAEEEPVAVKSMMDASYPDPEDMPMGGALTITDAENWVQAQQAQQRLYDLWWMFETVVSNILNACPDMVPDKAAAMKAAIEDFKSNIDASAVVAMAQLRSLLSQEVLMADNTPATPTPVVVPVVAPHPLDNVFTAFRAKYDEVMADPNMDRQTRLKAFQPAMNELGAQVIRSVDVASPTTVTDIEAAVTSVVEKLLGPVLEKLALTTAVQQSQTSATIQTPAPRQVTQAVALQQQSTAAATRVPGKASIAQLVAATTFDPNQRMNHGR